jgi:PAS domain S-box-containing protein
MLSIPIIENGKAQAIFGVGNKTDLYSEDDVVQLDLVANELNKIIKQRRAESELREAKEKYHSLFANMLDGFAYCKMIFDVEGKPIDFVYLEVNDAFERLTGLKKETVVGKKVTEAISGIKDANPEVFEIYGRAALTGKEEKFELFFKPLSIWLAISVYSPRRGYFAAVFENITGRKIAEEALIRSEKKYRRLFETSQDGIMARDIDGRMIDCNRAYARMIGYSKKELRALSVQKLLPEKWHEQREKIVKEILETGGSAVFEREYQREDGVIFPASVRSWRLTNENGKPIGVWSIVRDITQQKELQNKLQQYAVHLEQLVEERTMQLKNSERLAAVGATAGMVGHDIRNPLQAITSDVYLAKTDLASMPEGEEKEGMNESLESIEKNVEYINKIVQDLQDYAKPIKLSMQETDFEELVEEVLFGVPESVDVSSQVNEEAKKLIADPAMLKRILSNLINNAVQAMPEGGKLDLQAHQDSTNGDIVVTLQDTGVGIPEEIKPKLFTPLFTTKSKGQGFGLAVVKRLTEALGGTITFESEIGKGTKFIMRLPPP